MTHQPFQPWCLICVKNAARNNPHKKVSHVREAEMSGMDYMYISSKPTGEEIAHLILVIKATISVGVWALPVTRKGQYLSNIIQRVNKIIKNGLGEKYCLLSPSFTDIVHRNP